MNTRATHLLIPVLVSTVLVTNAFGRVFDTEQQYTANYGQNVNKGVPAPPPYKFCLYFKKQLRVLVLFQNQVSQGEVISKPNSRLSEADIANALAANQGGATWKKENLPAPPNSPVQQVTTWQRSDGRLFAAFIPSSPVAVFLIGTRAAGEFLMREKDRLTSYVKQ